MYPTLQIQPSESQARSMRLLEYLKRQQFASIVLFDNFHITSILATIPCWNPE